MTRKTVGMQVLLGLFLWGMAEIAAFVVIGAWIGVLGVLAVVLCSAAMGVVMLRRLGMQAVGQIQSGMLMLKPATLGGSGLLVVSGVLLMLPGMLGDLLGLVLLVPGVRRIIIGRVAMRFQPDPQEDVLEGYAVEVEAPRLGREIPSGWTRP
ncbi:MAG: FxsA family protein [Alphaproteobacteria bacterium]